MFCFFCLDEQSNAIYVSAWCEIHHIGSNGRAFDGHCLDADERPLQRGLAVVAVVVVVVVVMMVVSVQVVNCPRVTWTLF